jgi:hypothetical protein
MAEAETHGRQSAEDSVFNDALCYDGRAKRPALKSAGKAMRRKPAADFAVLSDGVSKGFFRVYRGGPVPENLVVRLTHAKRNRQ